MNVRRCPVCAEVVLVAIEGEIDEEELENKQAAHDVMKAHV